MATAALGGMALAEPAEAMTRYRWKYRPLVVFAADAGVDALAAQKRIVGGRRAGFAARDVVVVYVAGEAVSVELGPSPGQSAAAPRTRHGVGREAFRVVLLGKDGGVKLSSPATLDAASLFSTIDAMPMRADEMRRR